MSVAGPSSSVPGQNWIDLVGGIARTNDNQDLGNVEAVRDKVIVVRRILLSFVHIHYYYIPFIEVECWDGKVVWLKISREQVERQYSRHDLPAEYRS